MERNKQKVYIHADDYGINGDSLKELNKACTSGIVNCVSVVVTNKKTKESIKEINNIETIETFLHLNLTEGSCVSDPQKIPLIVNEKGQFKNSFFKLLLKTLNIRKKKEILSQIYIEMCAQIEEYKKIFPKKSIRIDSHHHIHMIPRIFNTLLKVIEDKKIKVKTIRLSQESLLPFIKTPSLYFSYNPVSIIKNLVLNIFSCINRPKLERFGYNFNVFFGIMMTSKMDEIRVKKLIPHFDKIANKKNRNLEILLHPRGKNLADKKTALNKELLNDKEVKKKRYNRNDKIYNILLVILVLVIALILTRFKYIYGSTLDFKDQHWQLPEYFRLLFYETKQLIPNFALNLGAGQNIYYLAYEGLLNPIIMLSYLFPFIKMIDYIIITNILGTIISILLFYRWLKNNQYSSVVCFITTFMFLTAGPIIFHSHRHIAFINYMPFLILSLMAVDIYFKDRKITPLIVSVFLIIMTSFYYSIGAILVICLYGIYRYLTINKKITIKSTVKEGIKFTLPVILGVMLAAFFLLPIFYVITNNNRVGKNILDIKSLLTPNFDLRFLLYYSYSIGLSAISVISLVNGIISKDKANKFLAGIIAMILIIPLFSYLLNGGLYIHAKSLIPFIPIICLLIANLLKKIMEKDSNKTVIIVTSVIASILLAFIAKNNYKLIFLVDVGVSLIIILLYLKKRKQKYLYLLLAIPLLLCFNNNLEDNLVLKKDFKSIFSEKQGTIIKETLRNDASFYRFSNQLYPLETSNKIYDHNYYTSSVYCSIFNSYYNNLNKVIFNNEQKYRNASITNETKNILFHTLIGAKYILTMEEPLIGYELVNKQDDLNIYRNDNVFSIGYVTDLVMNEADYRKLEYPYNVEALLNYVVIDNVDSSSYVSNIKKVNLDYNTTSIKNLIIESKEDNYIIEAKDNNHLILDLNNDLENDILIITFNVNEAQSCRLGDSTITINGMQNKLTCKSWKYHNNNYSFSYVLSSNEPIKQLEFNFTKGIHKISDVEIHTLDYNYVKAIKNNHDEFIVDRTKTKGDKIVGKINVQKDGFFATTIPYDKGFKVYVNNKLTDYELVNETFIGFPIKEGKYDITITYEAPYSNLGKGVSLISLIGFVIIRIKENSSNRKSK